MRQDFYAIYDELSRVYIKIPPARWAFARGPDSSSLSPIATTHVVERAIRDAVRELDLHGRVRPDAIHFLLVNMHQMVSLPVLLEAARSRKGRQVDREYNSTSDQQPYRYFVQELREAIRHDVALILSTAAAFAPNEISGGDILRSAANVYDRLKSAASNAWG